MIVALYILAALVAVGSVLYLLHRRDLRRHPQSAPDVAATEPEVCCGMHVTCEKDSLLAAVSEEIVYYDDEELDRFKGTAPDDYDDAAVEEFRNVLLTLLPADIAGWARSIQLRGLELPSAVRDELLMIVAEARTQKSR